MKLRVREMPPVWIELQDGGKVHVKRLPTSRIDRLRKLNTGLDGELDLTSFRKEMKKEQFLGWQGMEDPLSGEDIPFTEENLFGAIEHDIEFVNEVDAKLNQAYGRVKEKQGKNSESTP